MGERRILTFILLTSLTFLLMAQFTYSCNQMLCASVVSKCMLTQSCKCDLKNCTCCRDCYQCLSWLWQECCSCVGELALLRETISVLFILHLSTQICVRNRATRKIRCQSSRIMRSSKAFPDSSTPCSKTTMTSGPSSHSQSITTPRFTGRTQRIHNFICVSWMNWMDLNEFYLDLITDSADVDLQSIKDLKTVTVNCSVTYMSPCMSMIKW